MKTILVTGSAGFIGAALVKRLLSTHKDYYVVGIDSVNDYYDVKLKEYRLSQIDRLQSYRYKFYKGDISNPYLVRRLFSAHKFDIVVNLAAQAGVRYSIINPQAYIDSNITGFFNVLDESCRIHNVEHFIYASSSSVYGDSGVLPLQEGDRTDAPLSLYAATKKSNEIMAHSYNSLYGVPMTGLRFFTVYGEAGRPDMAYYKFADSFVRGETISLYNYGDCSRDFTYVGDVIDSILAIIEKGPQKEGSNIYNIGCSNRVRLYDFVETLHDALKQANVLHEDHILDYCIKVQPKQNGDVQDTYSDTRKLESDYRVKPSVLLKDGLYRFAQWYKEYHSIDK